MFDAKTIYAGDSVELALAGRRLSNGDLADLSTGYTCNVKVFGTSIDRAVTTLAADEDGNLSRYFLVKLTEVETAGLSADSYPYAVTIAKAADGFKHTDEGTLTVITLPGAQPDPVSDLRAELAAVRAARIDLMTGKTVQKIRTGRYATEMWYASASLADYDKMIATLEREIAAAEAVAAGRPKRRPINLVWN